MTLESIAKNIRRFRIAVATHDIENPAHTSYGIGVAQFDMDRLGFEEGEELRPGYKIHADGKGTGNFRVLCDGDHDECNARDKAEREAGGAVEAVGREMVPA